MIFHLGPAGRMFALCEIERDTVTAVDSAAPGGVFTSLRGRRSQDRTGPHRRTWDLEWLYRERGDYDLVDALRRGHLGWPLRLIDPNLPNLLAAQIATGGTEERSVYGWSTVVGARRWVRPATPPPDDLLAVGAIEWTKPSAQDDLATGRADPVYRVPAPPGGGPIAVAARMLHADVPGDVAVVPGIDWWTTTGARSTLFATPRMVRGSWADVAFTLELPAGAAEWAPMWRIAAGTTATITVAGVRGGYGTAAPPPDRGGGSAEVLITGLPLTYPSEHEFSFSLKIEES